MSKVSDKLGAIFELNSATQISALKPPLDDLNNQQIAGESVTKEKASIGQKFKMKLTRGQNKSK
ncbi:MAG: hypothetical protein QM644_17550 [Mobilitalea sp.]